MGPRRWLLRIVVRSLSWRRGRTLLLVLMLTMAASLVTALGIISASIGTRVTEELRRYGANLVIMPESARIDVGSGGFNFGIVSVPAYLDEASVAQALVRAGVGQVPCSAHLRGTLRRGTVDVAVEGVHFAQIRQLFPWWQLRGGWPAAGGGVAGSELAARLGLKVGDTLTLRGATQEVTVRIEGVVATGGEEDRLLYLDLGLLQQALALSGRVSQVRLLTDAGREKPGVTAARIQTGLAGASVREVRQVARTSEGLLRKVQLLLFIVTLVVVVACGASVAGTMGTTVLERSREIGLLKAMGGTRGDVLLLFVVEGLVVGVLGGLAGFLAGSGIAALAAWSVFAAAGEFLPRFLPHALGVSLLLAFAGSIGPFMTVFRLDPVVSLRGE
ncbi:MAG TPA: ABC transporter permease [Geobacteraceae bacterium]